MSMELVNDDNEELRGELEGLIYRFNVQATGIDDGRPLRLAHRAGTDLVAGLVGWTWGGSGYIEFLWVREDKRGQGLGSTSWPTPRLKRPREAATRSFCRPIRFKRPLCM